MVWNWVEFTQGWPNTGHVSGPVFEFFIMNATNAESTPLLNLFQIEAIFVY